MALTEGDVIHVDLMVYTRGEFATYLFIDKDYGMAAISAMSACTFGLGKVANLLGQSARMAKTARTLRSAASLIGNVGSFAANASGLMSTGFSMYEKYVIQEQEMNDSTLLEVVGLGMSAIGCIMSGRGVSNDVRQLGSMLGDADFMNVMRNEIAQLGCDVKTNVSGGRRVYCFVAGTLVHTPEGKTAIEDIEPGDHVLAYNEETGETGYKEVVQLFRNTTEELAHVQVAGMEEILCTPGHKFYVQGEWIAASELTIGDILTLADGTTAEVLSVTLEELETPVTIYNFEVADWHNYYVGDSGVLVHNEGCGGSGIDVNPQSVMLGEDWNNYFRETYGYENVNWDTAFDSPNDIIEMPSSVARMNPEGLYNYLNESGLNVGPLGQGQNAQISFLEGGGYNAHFRTQYGDSYIQYNPSSAHHGGVPYYKVSSGNTFSYTGSRTGTQRFYLNGDIMND